ncbi:hypothetical protein GCM10011506_36470 [Marivirga lumbricoides]|uniref:Uncharacterized protein n=1 Tax=Marivirga lumbricoides TaxID=1046115 RepID=A0ABQ1MYW9_9BACT|nr:hypothetical protein GCM10011506_36470 [Marivirga lumbricoides]
MKLLKVLFNSKKFINLKLEIGNGKYHEELVEIKNLSQRIEELHNHYFPHKDTEKIESIWCLVGNIINEHYYGEEKEIRRGTKRFRPGAKVYCFPPQWGDGYEKIMVIGKSRKSKRFITVVLSAKLITNWRIQRVHTPFLKRKMLENGGWDNSDQSKKRIEEMLKWLPGRTETMER